jgi:hypothetical protein
MEPTSSIQTGLEIIGKEMEKSLEPRTRLLAFPLVSNKVKGTQYSVNTKMEYEIGRLSNRV